MDVTLGAYGDVGTGSRMVELDAVGELIMRLLFLLDCGTTVGLCGLFCAGRSPFGFVPARLDDDPSIS
jgi:hypothetical protein